MNNTTPDPKKTQERIIHTLQIEFPQIDSAQMTQLVHDAYGRLSHAAKVSQHIPALVEGKIRRLLKHREYLIAGGH